MRASIAYTHKTRLSRLALLFATGITTLLFFLRVPLVHAEPQVKDPVKTFCYNTLDDNKATKGARSACDDTSDNIKYARNAASYHCIDQPIEENQKAKCIEEKAIGFIRDAASSRPLPSKPAEFSKYLVDLLEKDVDKTGGSLLVAEESSQQGEPSKTFCLETNPNCIEATTDPAACAANPQLKGCGSDPTALCTVNNCDLIKKYVNPSINILSVIFGLIAVISLIIGGIQYSASGGDTQKVTEAKKRISKTLVAFISYALLFGFLQFLIPGGIFNR